MAHTMVEAFIAEMPRMALGENATGSAMHDRQLVRRVDAAICHSSQVTLRLHALWIRHLQFVEVPYGIKTG